MTPGEENRDSEAEQAQQAPTHGHKHHKQPDEIPPSGAEKPISDDSNSGA